MDIEKSFRHTKYLSEEQTNLINAVENGFVSMAKMLNYLPESREKSLALTNLQQSKMWAIECITKVANFSECL